MIIPVNLAKDSYDIILERGALSKCAEYLNLNRRVLVVTDDGVPENYAKTVASHCKEGYIITISQGETSKNFENYQKLLSKMLENNFSRQDCVVAVGGGVIGDMAGFAAATYMRGIDFYNIPTTLLSQVDSSIGGKVAIDFGGVKNIVGAFHQPKRVIIDPELLKTLDKRQVSAGLAESIKMAVTCNGELFEFMEKSEDLEEDIDRIIEGSLLIKKNVVETDPTEKGLRRVLNFGHTLGHAVESSTMGQILHGECVAIGMLPMCSEEVGTRLKKVLEKYSLPTGVEADKEVLFEYLSHDKKAVSGGVVCVFCDKVGSFQMEKVSLEEIKVYLENISI